MADPSSPLDRQTPERPIRQRHGQAPMLLLVGWTLMVGVLALWSLQWRLWRDAAFVQYISWLLDRGYRPYVDVFDIQLPGTYLVYIVGQRLFGLGDHDFATFNLCWLALTCMALWRCVRALGRLPAALAVLMLSTFYLVGAPSHTMERDWLMVLPISLAFAEVLRPRPDWRHAAWAGSMIACAMLVKPQALILGPIVALLLFLRSTEWRRRVAWVAGLVAGMSFPLLVTGAWLWSVGSLDAFVWTWTHYVVPLYAQLTRAGVERTPGFLAYVESSIQTLRTLFAPKYLLLTLGTAAAAGAAVWQRRQDREERLRVFALLAWLFYGIIHVVWAGKGFTYHFWPFFSAGIGLMAWLAVTPCSPQDDPSLPPSRSSTWLARVNRLVPPAYAVAGMAAITLRLLGFGGGDAQFRRDMAVVDRLALALESRAQPGDRVQVLDTVEGAAAAALIARMEPGSRFVDDFHFFHHEGTRTNMILRRQLLEDLQRIRPRFVAAWGASWAHRTSFRDLERFTELSNALRSDYVVVIDSPVYRLYERKPRL